MGFALGRGTRTEPDPSQTGPSTLSKTSAQANRQTENRTDEKDRLRKEIADRDTQIRGLRSILAQIEAGTLRLADAKNPNLDKQIQTLKGQLTESCLKRDRIRISNILNQMEALGENAFPEMLDGLRSGLPEKFKDLAPVFLTYRSPAFEEWVLAQESIVEDDIRLEATVCLLCRDPQRWLDLYSNSAGQITREGPIVIGNCLPFLEQFGEDPRVGQILEAAACKHPLPNIRKSTVRYLKDTHALSRDRIDNLLREIASTDPDPQVREAAAKALEPPSTIGTDLVDPGR